MSDLQIRTGLIVLLPVLLLLEACGPSEKQKAQWAEQKRVECLDKICPGDIGPQRDHLKESISKIGGQWFIAPNEYGNPGHLAFFWPSKSPARASSSDASEFVPSSAGVNSNFYDVAIEIFLRSNNIPPEPHGYKLIELAERQGWIADRKTLRPGLDAVRMKHVMGPRGYAIDHVTYYIATDLKGFDNLPPVATCNHDHPSNAGGTGFIWKPGIWLGTRWNQKHCADWPEIYQEVVRVMSLIREK